MSADRERPNELDSTMRLARRVLFGAVIGIALFMTLLTLALFAVGLMTGEDNAGEPGGGMATPVSAPRPAPSAP